MTSKLKRWSACTTPASSIVTKQRCSITLAIVAFAILLVLSMADIRHASAQELLREDKNWRIMFEPSGPYCLAIQKFDPSSGLTIRREPTSLRVSIGDPKLLWLDNNRTYDVTILIDRSRWHGEMLATRHSDSGAIHVTDPAPQFVEAVQHGSRLSVVIQNAKYGPYPLSGTRTVFSDLDACVATYMAPQASQPETPTAVTEGIPTYAMQMWGETDVGKVFSNGDISVRIVALTNSGDATVNFEVAKDGMAPITLKMPSGGTPTGQMGLFNIGEGQLKLVLTTYTGGAHCCTAIQIVDFSSGFGRVLNVGSFDGDNIAPEDIDRDGQFELALRDERFLYVFDGYAGSFPPAMILTVKNGELKDVTRNSAFSSYNQVIYKAQSEACGGAAGEHPGPCAGLAGTASILGVLPETLHYINFRSASERAAAEPFKICEDRNCRKSKEFSDYREALFHSLDVWGYRAERPNPQFSEFMKRLVGRRYGEEKGSEMSCELEPTAISETESPIGSTIFEVAEYEQGCVASNGVVVGSSVVLRAVCQGEGSSPWLASRIYAVDGSRLFRSSFNDASVLDSKVFEMKECAPQNAPTGHN